MKARGFLIIVCFVFLLASCGPKPEKTIIGKWERTGDSKTIEFFEDGTVSIVKGEMCVGGDYKFIDAKRMRLELGGVWALIGPIIYNVSIAEDKLILTTADGESSEYQKVK